jgi:hypothetical protein
MNHTKTSVPSVAKEAFDALHSYLSKETEIKKDDLWIAVMKSFLWLTEEQQQNALKDVGVEMYNKK